MKVGRLIKIEDVMDRLQNDDMLDALDGFAREVVSGVGGGEMVDVEVGYSRNVMREMPGVELSKEFVVMLRGDWSGGFVRALSRFLHKRVSVFEDVVYWEEGDTLNGDGEKRESEKKNGNIVDNRETLRGGEFDGKWNGGLPGWLDEFIFGQLGARYAPDHERFGYNLDLEDEGLKVYLGTYFPRSFAEANGLFGKLCDETGFAGAIEGKTSLNVLDLGCGSGGNIFGLLSFVESRFPSVERVKVLAIDGNHGALRLFERVMKEYRKRSRLEIEYQVGPLFIGDGDDLQLAVSIVQDKEFDVVMSFKAICELVNKKRLTGNAYAYCAGLLAPLLSRDGVLLFVDVTVRSDVAGQFLPQYMNTGLNDFVVRSAGRFGTILPASCRCHGKRCAEGCFFKETVEVSHSRRRGDTSKIVYRFMGREEFARRICIAPGSNDVICKYN